VFLSSLLAHMSLLFNFFPNNVYVEANKSQKRVKLFSHADPSSSFITSLKAGDTAKYLYSGKTKKWHYLEYQGQTLAVHHNNIEFGYFYWISILLTN